jgi:hypothetical protein
MVSGTGGGNGHAFLHHAVNQLRAVCKRVQDVMHLAVGFGVFHFKVRHGALQAQGPS